MSVTEILLQRTPNSTYEDVQRTQLMILAHLLSKMPWCPHHEKASMLDGGCDTNETILEVTRILKEELK